MLQEAASYFGRHLTPSLAHELLSTLRILGPLNKIALWTKKLRKRARAHSQDLSRFRFLAFSTAQEFPLTDSTVKRRRYV
jgi:hypothetical protein